MVRPVETRLETGSEERLRQACAELRRRFQARQSCRAEELFAEYPDLAEQPDLAIELVYAEFATREEFGERLRAAEFSERFPQLRERLERLLLVHERMRDACSETNPLGTADRTVEVGPQGTSQRVSGYEVLHVLGQGGMGIVYKARQSGLNRLVALKMILSGRHAPPKERERFRGEAEAVARLQHPNVVQIYEAGEHQGTPFLSLEYVEGGTLAEKINGYPQPVRDAAALTATVARAVQAAHDKGIVHRDLKPANILLTSDGVPKITDFGLAKHLDAEQTATRDRVALGTPCYMSPEQATAEADIGPQTDVWALGAILYELLTGRPPFVADSPLDSLYQVVHTEPVPPGRLRPRLPVDLETICLKCLQKERRGRYATASEVADDLDRFLGGHPIRARPVGPLSRCWRWCRRKPLVAGLTAAVVALSLAGIGGILWQWQRAERERDEALRQFGRAERNSRRALEAVDRLLTQVGQHRLAHVPQFEDVRRRLLEDALQFHQQFLEENSADPRIRRETAQSLVRVAVIYRMLGKLPEAQTAHERAEQLQRRLIADRPDEPQYQADLAGAQVNAGILFHSLGLLPRAKAAWSEAASLNRRLMREDPDRSEHPNGLARALNGLATIAVQTNQPDQAEALLEEAAPLCEHLLSGKAAAPELYRTLLALQHNLGNIYRQRGKLKLAEQTLTRSLATWRNLAAIRPHDPECRSHEATLQYTLGALYRDQKRPQDADAAFQRSLALRQQLARDFPQVLDYQHDVAASFNSLGVLHYQAGRLTEAEKAYQQARTLWSDLARDYPRWYQVASSLGLVQQNLAEVLRDQGDATAALAWSDEAIRTLRQALQVQPHEPHARRYLVDSYVVRAKVLSEQGSHHEALGAIDAALPLAEPSRRASLNQLRDDLLARQDGRAGVTLDQR